MSLTAAPSAPLSRPAALLAAAASALLLALAMPGLVGWWPLLAVALVPLLAAARRLPPLRSGCFGLLCGLLYHLSLLYWVVIVLGRYGGLHPVPAAGALLLLALHMSLYTALFCWLLSLFSARPGRAEGNSSAAILLAAPPVWVGLDVLRGWLFTGMPWMDLGYGLYKQPMLIQAADLGGHHLLTFCIVLVNALLFWLLDRSRPAEPVRRHQHYFYAVMACLLLYAVSGYSCLRYQEITSAAAEAVQAAVAAVQANISQEDKWSPDLKEKTVDRYLSLSERAFKDEEELDLLVWPETALPFYPPREPLMQRVKDFAGKKRVQLLTGAPFFTVHPEKKNPVEYFNSAVLLDRSGQLTDRYNKQHLVPFGEYVPLRNYLWFLKPVVELIGDFTPGTSSAPLQAEKIRAGVLICFESVFPEIARRETAAGANLLVTLTNDAWYGRSSAPVHSWAMTVLRAVENRRSMVRAANTGISGFVGPTGDIRAESPLFAEDALTDSLPLLTEQTVFVRGGHWFGPACLALIPPLLWFFAGRRRQPRKPSLRSNMSQGQSSVVAH